MSRKENYGGGVRNGLDPFGSFETPFSRRWSSCAAEIERCIIPFETDKNAKDQASELHVG